MERAAEKSKILVQEKISTQDTKRLKAATTRKYGASSRQKAIKKERERIYLKKSVDFGCTLDLCRWQNVKGRKVPSGLRYRLGPRGIFARSMYPGTGPRISTYSIPTVNKTKDREDSSLEQKDRQMRENKNPEINAAAKGSSITDDIENMDKEWFTPKKRGFLRKKTTDLCNEKRFADEAGLKMEMDTQKSKARKAKKKENFNRYKVERGSERNKESGKKATNKVGRKMERAAEKSKIPVQEKLSTQDSKKHKAATFRKLGASSRQNAIKKQNKRMYLKKTVDFDWILDLCRWFFPFQPEIFDYQPKSPKTILLDFKNHMKECKQSIGRTKENKDPSSLKTVERHNKFKLMKVNEDRCYKCGKTHTPYLKFCRRLKEKNEINKKINKVNICYKVNSAHIKCILKRINELENCEDPIEKYQQNKEPVSSANATIENDENTKLIEKCQQKKASNSSANTRIEDNENTQLIKKYQEKKAQASSANATIEDKENTKKIE